VATAVAPSEEAVEEVDVGMQETRLKMCLLVDSDAELGDRIIAALQIRYRGSW